MKSEKVFYKALPCLLSLFILSIIRSSGGFVKESPLMIKSKLFALQVIDVCKELRNAKCESALINQFLRSGTSIGANIREAFYAHGKADFIAKLQIALKECSESEYWIELLLESGYYNNKSLLDDCTEVKRILISSINTARENNK